MKCYKRIELHNHSTESDGGMSVPQLVDYLYANQITCFALTDHNTTSGTPKIEAYLQEAKLPMQHLPGFELTSYHGHILCYNMGRYIPWDDIDKYNGDLLFNRVHQQGGIVGIAHPFSVPAPIANGMRFDMHIHNHDLLDFIEVINNAHSMVPDNIQGILWWEELLFKGHRIAATTGMDLHRPSDLTGYFTTYFLEEDPSLPLASSFAHAIGKSQTMVTKGPLIVASLREDHLDLELEFKTTSCTSLYAIVKTGMRSLTLQLVPLSTHITTYFVPQPGEKAVIVELYEGSIEPDYLVTIAPPIYL